MVLASLESMIEPVGSKVIISISLLIAAKCWGMERSAAILIVCRMLYMEHLVIEDIFDYIAGNGPGIKRSTDDDGVVN